MKGGRSASWRLTDDPAVTAVTGIDVANWLAERKSWLALVYGTACLAAAVYLSLQHLWLMALIWAVWSVIAIRRWFWTRLWARKSTMRR